MFILLLSIDVKQLQVIRVGYIVMYKLPWPPYKTLKYCTHNHFHKSYFHAVQCEMAMDVVMESLWEFASIICMCLLWTALISARYHSITVDELCRRFWQDKLRLTFTAGCWYSAPTMHPSDCSVNIFCSTAGLDNSLQLSSHWSNTCN